MAIFDGNIFFLRASDFYFKFNEKLTFFLSIYEKLENDKKKSISWQFINNNKNIFFK